MEWLCYTISAEEKAEETITGMLSELGIDSLEIIEADPLSAEDKAAMFLEPDAELQPDAPVPEGTLKIRFYLHPADDPDPEISAQAAEGTDDSYTIHDRRYTPEEIRFIEHEVKIRLDELQAEGVIGKALLSKDRSRESEWRDNWKKYFHPIEADGFLICPIWSEVPAEAAGKIAEGCLTLLRLEPGTAFGTGAHASTRLCLDGMMEYIRPGDKLLDIGTGSGILGIAALLSGAESVTATEVDPSCGAVVKENLRLNGIADENSSRFRLLIGDILSNEAVKRAAAGRYDIITANILAPVILRLAAPGAADRFLRPGGVMVNSGIIGTRAEEVADAFDHSPAWTDVKILRQGEWAAVTAVRTAQDP